MKHIEFITDEENIDAIPHPVPATEFLPDWFKSMSSKMDEQKPSHINNPTMKVCPGIHDILKLGYIIPAWCDFYVDLRTPEQGVGFESSTGEDFLDIFPLSVSKGFTFPLGHQPIFLKFKSPWRIQSKENISVLLSKPKYQYNKPYKVYEGSMDVNPYIADINFIITVQQGTYIEFKRGDPLLQLIPFTTDNFVSKIVAKDDKIYSKWKKQMKAIKSFSFGGYFNTFHRKKTYK